MSEPRKIHLVTFKGNGNDEFLAARADGTAAAFNTHQEARDHLPYKMSWVRDPQSAGAALGHVTAFQPIIVEVTIADFKTMCDVPYEVITVRNSCGYMRGIELNAEGKKIRALGQVVELYPGVKKETVEAK